MAIGNWRLLLAFVAAALLGVMATTPPDPAGLSAAPQAFSAERAMLIVDAIANEPHATGTAANALVRDKLMQRLTALGFEVSTSQWPINAEGLKIYEHWSGVRLTSLTLTNIVAVLPGRNRSLPAVALMAHHDTVWGSPGAADDSAAIAVSLEVARAIRAGGVQERDLVLIFTDGEELGLQGARQFFATHPLRIHIGAVINMEARGGGGRTTLFQTSRDNGDAVRLYAGAVRAPAASSLSAYIYSLLPNDTDLTPVLKGPWLGYNFAFIGRPELYHSPKAVPDRLDRGAVQDMGGQVLGLARALLTAKALPQPAPDAVFFDLFGLTTLFWPPWTGWIMLGLGLAATVAALRPLEGKAVAAGAGRMTGLLLLSGALFWVLNCLSRRAGAQNYYDRLAAIPRLEVIVVLAGLAVIMLVWGRRKPVQSELVGASLPLLILAAAGQALAPTAAYFMVVPAMFAGFALLANARLGTRARVWITLITGAPVAGYMVGLSHQLMLGVGPTMSFLAALPLAIGTMALLPLSDSMLHRRAQVSAVILLVAACGVALWVRLDPVADTIAVYSDKQP